METKTCKKCGAERQLSHFYKHPKAADGHDNSCKECRKEAVRKNRKRNADYYRAYDAKRFKEDPKVRERHKRYQQTPDGKKSMNAARKKWGDNNSDKKAASTLINNRVRDGRILKPDKCRDCGSTGRIEGHHEDYSKPLEVVWLCRQCHVNRHKEN